MTHYLRLNGQTLVDIETTKDDIQCVIDIGNYSRYLLSNVGNSETIVRDFDAIQEIRGAYFEQPHSHAAPSDFAKNYCKDFASKYGFSYVTD